MKTSGDTGHGISSIYGTTGGSPSHPDTAREMREIFGDNVLVKKQQQANNSNPPKDAKVIDLYVIYHYVRRNIDFSIFLMICLGVGAIQIYIDIHEISLAIHGCMEFLQRLWIHMESTCSSPPVNAQGTRRTEISWQSLSQE